MEADMGNDSHVIASFNNRTKSDRAFERLVQTGLRPDQMSLMVSEDGRSHHFEVSDNQTKTAEGAGYGAVLGGLAAGLTAAALPGSIFVAGPLAGALASGAAGAAAGGLAGSLIGMGIAEDEVKLVEEEMGRGDIVVAVHSIDSSQEDKVRNILEDGATRVH